MLNPLVKEGMMAVSMKRARTSQKESVGTFLEKTSKKILPLDETALAWRKRHVYASHTVLFYDLWTIATVCMFLAGVVEETPRPLNDVILESYVLIHEKDPEAVQRIKQKEVYVQQKKSILLGERVVLETLGYDFNVHLPYGSLIRMIKTVAQNDLAQVPSLTQVSWNFLNDGLCTSLCLQFEPHSIAAGAIFLAVKLLKVKLPSDREKNWWQEFDVTLCQLEEVCNQLLDLYDQSLIPDSIEGQGSAGNGDAHGAPAKVTTSNEEHATSNSDVHAGCTSSGIMNPASSSPEPEQSDVGNDDGPPRTTQCQNNHYKSADMHNAPDQNVDVESKGNQHAAPLSSDLKKMGESQNVSQFGSDGCDEESHEDIQKFNTERNREIEGQRIWP